MTDRLMHEVLHMGVHVQWRFTVTLAKLQQKLRQLREFTVTFPSIKIYGGLFNSSGVITRADGQTVEQA